MSEQESEAFQLAAELERTDSPLRRPDTVALRAAELLRQQWQDIQHACAAERERAVEHTHAIGKKVLLIREQHAEIERLRADAERYRWLRDWKRGEHDIVPTTGRYCDTPILREELDLAIDAALDAAMAEESKP